MPGLMQWRSASETDRTKILWIQEPGQPWKRYNACSIRVPDYTPVSGIKHSKGWAAMQHYKNKLGYTLIASDPTENQREDAEFAKSQVKMMPLSGLSEQQRQRWSA